MTRNKLKHRRGETLTEVLVSVLVVAMSIALLAGMVGASMRMNAAARNLDSGSDGNGGFYGELSEVETHVFTSADAPITVLLTGDGRSPVELTGLRSYRAGTGQSLCAYGTGG